MGLHPYRLDTLQNNAHQCQDSLDEIVALDVLLVRRQTKVSQEHMYILALSSNKDVLGLQTAMIHALFVTVLDRVENLTKGVLDLLRRPGP